MDKNTGVSNWYRWCLLGVFGALVPFGMMVFGSKPQASVGTTIFVLVFCVMGPVALFTQLGISRRTEVGPGTRRNIVAVRLYIRGFGGLATGYSIVFLIWSLALLLR